MKKRELRIQSQKERKKLDLVLLLFPLLTLAPSPRASRASLETPNSFPSPSSLAATSLRRALTILRRIERGRSKSRPAAAAVVVSSPPGAAVVVASSSASSASSASMPPASSYSASSSSSTAIGSAWSLSIALVVVCSTAFSFCSSAASSEEGTGEGGISRAKEKRSRELEE